MRSNGLIQTKIAHYRRHDRVLREPARGQKIESRYGENLVAIDNFGVLVAKQDAVSVAVMSNSNICAAQLNDALNFFRMYAAAAIVDVHAVRLVVRESYIRT